MLLCTLYSFSITYNIVIYLSVCGAMGSHEEYADVVLSGHPTSGYDRDETDSVANNS